MKFRSAVILTAASLLLAASFSFAAETPAPAGAVKHAKASPKSTKGGKPAKKSKSNVKLVDINSAGKAELKSVPGISDALADKIIAGRPFGSKADLVSRNIIPSPDYSAISSRIVVKLPYKDAAKNIEYLKKKK